MNAELKEKWLTALRSGKYKQGSGLLYWPPKDTHCCLGVLCEIGNLTRNDLVSSSTIFEYNGDSSCMVLPETFADEIGITDNEQRQLTSMNDDQGRSFTQIADWIESNL